ncbi:hypothetical protein BSI_23170 [Bacillus inaquosorum KCTC 13429]|uniref:Uncharacterized protein n=1 Tax=Bacillus inaquosorum KCTC 13429 TaxID=1236548 RepID=A0A9W5PCK2_9BACI|nr:hypothetical protein BSI_23170 [Bacillus inaquosorum KCTC 13429]
MYLKYIFKIHDVTNKRYIQNESLIKLSQNYQFNVTNVAFL